MDGREGEKARARRRKENKERRTTTQTDRQTDRQKGFCCQLCVWQLCQCVHNCKRVNRERIPPSPLREKGGNQTNTLPNHLVFVAPGGAHLLATTFGGWGCAPFRSTPGYHAKISLFHILTPLHHTQLTQQHTKSTLAFAEPPICFLVFFENNISVSGCLFDTSLRLSLDMHVYVSIVGEGV